MPVNRNALIRYRTLDNCLRNRHRRWTLDDLVEACSEALYEYEGIEKGVSKRSVQMDIQLMRSDKLGYNAPIMVIEKKYYTYEDPDYSITNIPLTDQDLGKLSEVLEILRQFKGFSHFQELSGMVQRLENKIHSAKTHQEPIIDFEKNENLKGLEHIDSLYQAILNKKVVELTYQSFKARSANAFNFHAYYLKEYRNRWFVLGQKKKDSPMMTLALDRIVSIRESNLKYYPLRNFSLSDYYQHIIGVTVEPNRTPEKIVFLANKETAPYVETKPLHHSQKLIETTYKGTLFSIDVQINFELEREILGFGDRLQIIAPAHFRRRITQQLENALDFYSHDLNESVLQNVVSKVASRGYAILQHVYRRKEVNLIKNILANYLNENPQEEAHAIRNLLTRIPDLAKLVFNDNLKTILSRFNPKLFLIKSIYFDKSPEANWYVTWHQDITIHVKEKIKTEGYTGWTEKSDYYGVCPPDEILKNTLTVRIHLDDTDEDNGALKIIPGSQNKKLLPSEIQLISQNSLPKVCEVVAGGIHLMKPLLLHASSKSVNQKHRRVLHLEFNTLELDGELAWAEKQLI